MWNETKNSNKIGLESQELNKIFNSPDLSRANHEKIEKHAEAFTANLFEQWEKQLGLFAPNTIQFRSPEFMEKWTSFQWKVTETLSADMKQQAQFSRNKLFDFYENPDSVNQTNSAPLSEPVPLIENLTQQMSQVFTWINAIETTWKNWLKPLLT